MWPTSTRSARAGEGPDAASGIDDASRRSARLRRPGPTPARNLPAAGHEGPYAAKYGTDGAAGLNSDYAPVAEQMGRSFIAPLIFNSNAPDTGNMEVILKYGSQAQRDRWLDPLLTGGFAAPSDDRAGCAASDATNMAATARGSRATRSSSTAASGGRPARPPGPARSGIYMALTDETADRHHQHSIGMVLVPMDAPGSRSSGC